MSNNMFDMVKQATAMKAQLAKIEKELSNMRFESEASKGNAKVIAIVSGKQEVIGLSISEEAKALPSADLARLILQAITKGQSDSKNEAAKLARNLQLE